VTTLSRLAAGNAVAPHAASVSHGPARGWLSTYFPAFWHIFSICASLEFARARVLFYQHCMQSKHDRNKTKLLVISPKARLSVYRRSSTPNGMMRAQTT
jgi:hypothetical protein